MSKLSRRFMLAGLGATGMTGAIASASNAQTPAQTPASEPTPLAQARPSNQGKFADHVILITGATSGIGMATAQSFAQQGAKVFFCGRREDKGAEVEAAIRQSGGEATFMRADVRREAEVKAFVDACVRTYGKIDVAFNNAGILQPQLVNLAEQPTEDFQDCLNTNVLGTFLSMKYELSYMVTNPPSGSFGTKGVIINNASVSGHVGFGLISPYSASKHALLGLTNCAAIEYGLQGVRVNSISPGGVDTAMRRQSFLARGFPSDQPLPTVPNLPRRVNTVDEIAQAVMFLASDAASSLFGTDLDLTGGMLTGAYFTQAPPTNRTDEKS
jgi:NAD(P)-dependent dehydrogenase (short-subunit alcohol dehydrogenase family)